MSNGTPPPSVSILVPIHNEQEALPAFFERLERVLASTGLPHEILCVDDGSTDRTAEMLARERARNPAIKIVTLTRNFGKEAALTAAFDLASGDAAIPIDADLQDPPELIPEMIRLWREGAEVIRARRADRQKDSWIKRTTAHLFYRAFNLLSRDRLPEHAGDFGLFDRHAIVALRRLRESNRFLKGLYPWIGFRTATLDFTRQRREGGRSKMGYIHLARFALDAITAFSTLPLRAWIPLGAIVTLSGLGLGLHAAIRSLAGSPPATPDIILVAILALGGLQLVAIGFVGEYVGRAYIEAKRRPIYLVRQTQGLPDPGRPARECEDPAFPAS